MFRIFALLRHVTASAVFRCISLRMTQFSLVSWTATRTLATAPHAGSRAPSATPLTSKVPATPNPSVAGVKEEGREEEEEERRICTSVEGSNLSEGCSALPLTNLKIRMELLSLEHEQV